MMRFPTPCYAPDNGAGTYTLPNAEPVNGNAGDATPIRESLEDVQDALTARLLANGTKTATANQPMGGFKHTNVAVAAARTDYARASQIADGSLTYGGVGGGTADAVTIAPSPAITAYAIGQQFQFKTGAGANTGAVTLNANGVGAGAVTWPDGTALAAGDLPANAMVLVEVQATTPVFHLQTATRAPLTAAASAAISKALFTPGHRLSLTTALGVTVSDVTAAATIYWTPYKHNISPIYNGTAWQNNAIAQLSFIIDSGNHLADKNYDFFLDYNSGTPRIVTGPAWTTDTARADALGVDATYGYVVNNASMTARISNNGGSFSLGAKTGLYLGTIRCTANAQTEDSHAKRFVWNNYNRAPRAMRVNDSTDSWGYSTATVRQARASTANQLDFVRGLDEDAVTATAVARWANDTSGQGGFTLIGLDSTTAAATGCQMVGTACHVANVVSHSQAHWSGFPGLGRRYLTWLEYATGGTQTWGGDSGLPTVIQSGINGMVTA